MVDENRDGVPDIFQSGGLSGVKETINLIKEFAQLGRTEGIETNQISLVRVTDSGIFMNGKEYSNTNDMPDHIRQEYNHIIANADDGTEDIFDESWRRVERDEYFDPHDDEIMNQQITKRFSNEDASIKMVDSTGRFIIIATLAALILGCLATVWFLMN